MLRKKRAHFSCSELREIAVTIAACCVVALMLRTGQFLAIGCGEARFKSGVRSYGNCRHPARRGAREFQPKRR
jgi:hypothetical protein